MTAPKQACWDRTEGCCMVDAFKARMKPKRRRAANGQRVTANSLKLTWWWDCDHAHDCSDGTVPFWGSRSTQDEAYAALDAHNAAHHPHLTEEARRG
jgi:hypothetical protein